MSQKQVTVSFCCEERQESETTKLSPFSSAGRISILSLLIVTFPVYHFLPVQRSQTKSSKTRRSAEDEDDLQGDEDEAER